MFSFFFINLHLLSSRSYFWRRKWQPTPVFLPGEAHGWRSLAGYGPRGHKGSDATECAHTVCLSIHPRPRPVYTSICYPPVYLFFISPPIIYILSSSVNLPILSSIHLFIYLSIYHLPNHPQVIT